jgi:hypothetical protein
VLNTNTKSINFYLNFVVRLIVCFNEVFILKTKRAGCAATCSFSFIV